jgi:hypothetical protein
VILAALAVWYIFAERLRLDDENRRELAHVAHDLENILTGEKGAAENFF